MCVKMGPVAHKESRYCIMVSKKEVVILSHASSGSEWLRQAMYDLETAEYLFSGSHYIYAVFMCHLAAEKALKGLYERKLRKPPPRTHNLLYLVKETESKLPDRLTRFLVVLNEASIVTRYPQSLDEARSAFTEERTRDILTKTREVLQWIENEW